MPIKSPNTTRYGDLPSIIEAVQRIETHFPTTLAENSSVPVIAKSMGDWWMDQLVTHQSPFSFFQRTNPDDSYLVGAGINWKNHIHFLGAVIRSRKIEWLHSAQIRAAHDRQGFICTFKLTPGSEAYSIKPFELPLSLNERLRTSDSVKITGEDIRQALFDSNLT